MPTPFPIVDLGGGGGGSLPATPASALLDVSNPSTLVGLDADGHGEALTVSQALARLGIASTTLTFSAEASKTFTPSVFPCGVTWRGFAKGTSGGCSVLAQSHIDRVAGVYSLRTVDVSDGDIFPDISINTSTGVLTITFPEAVTGRVAAETV